LQYVQNAMTRTHWIIALDYRKKSSAK